MAPVWTIMVIGPPTSGKSSLSRRLLESLKDSVRINPDEVRSMLFNDLAPKHDEDLVYKALSSLRDNSLAYGHSVIIDATAPRHLTREYLLSGSNRSRHLIVVMDVDRSILEERARRTDKLMYLRAFEEVWQEPHHTLPLFKFRNDNVEQFETSFYLLMEYINHEYAEHSSILGSLFRRGRRDDQLPDQGEVGPSPSPLARAREQQQRRPAPPPPTASSRDD
ncbi:MAG: ATP-binding protein [Nitrososphaerales archaeon]|jgi:predicted kinase